MKIEEAVSFLGVRAIAGAQHVQYMKVLKALGAVANRLALTDIEAECFRTLDAMEKSDAQQLSFEGFIADRAPQPGKDPA